jgi:rod shape-determining protein MreD
VRGLISFVIVAVTVVFQLTVVDRITFPGGSGPDLVLLAVAALALASGPMVGALTGFWAGLVLDVAPPGSHFVGQDALVFCLIGYACGLLADDSSGDGATEPGHTALFEIMVTAAGAICGEALAALLGVMLSDPRVTWPAITSVLPAAVAYDVLLCPFVLYAAAAALRLAGARREGRPVGLRVWSPARGGSPVPGAGLGVGGRPMAKREPHLKLGPGSSRGFGGSARVGSASPAGSIAGFRGGAGTAFTAGGRGGRGGRGGPAKVRFASSSMGRSWFGGSVFSRSSSVGGLGSPPGRSPVFGRPSALTRLTGALRRPAALRPAQRRSAQRRSAQRRSAQRRSAQRRHAQFRPAQFRHAQFRHAQFRHAQFRSAQFRSAQRRSPGKGWLRRTSARRTSMGRGWGSASQPRLRSGRSGLGGLRGLRGPARLHMPRSQAKRRWRPAKRRWRIGGYR